MLEFTFLSLYVLVIKSSIGY